MKRWMTVARSSRVARWAIASGSALVLGCASTSPVLAEDEVGGDLRSSVVTMLSGYEYIPSAADLAKLGPGVPDVLVALVDDEDAGVFRQVRALALLKHYPENEAVETFVRGYVERKDLTAIQLRTGLLTLGHVGGGGAVDRLTPFLGNEDPLTREAAAKALLSTGDPAAREALERAAGTEKEPFLRESMERMASDLGS